MDLPKRKSNRLKDYDYSSNGVYFITVCVKYKRKILGEVDVGVNTVHPYNSTYYKTVQRGNNKTNRPLHLATFIPRLYY